MSPSDLKYHVEQTGRDSHFFDRRTMRFFGDSMRNFGVRAVTVRAWGDTVDPVTNKYQLRTVDAWELYRKHPVKNRLRSSFYFDRVTFARLHGVQTN